MWQCSLSSNEHFDSGMATPPRPAVLSGRPVQTSDLAVVQAAASHGRPRAISPEDKELDAGWGQVSFLLTNGNSLLRFISKWINVITRCHPVKQPLLRKHFCFVTGRTEHQRAHDQFCTISFILVYVTHASHTGSVVLGRGGHFLSPVWFRHHLQLSWCFMKPTAPCPSAPPWACISLPSSAWGFQKVTTQRENATLPERTDCTHTWSIKPHPLRDT